MSERVEHDDNVDHVDVRDHPSAHRFEVWVGDELAGFTRYQAQSGDRYAFIHTEIDPRFEHRGLAGRLVSDALATARERGWSVLPQCPFVRSYLESHPDQVDLVPEDQRTRFGL
jgi:predicted GNAT family acetyltransferase